MEYHPKYSLDEWLGIDQDLGRRLKEIEKTESVQVPIKECSGPKQAVDNVTSVPQSEPLEQVETSEGTLPYADMHRYTSFFKAVERLLLHPRNINERIYVSDIATTELMQYLIPLVDVRDGITKNYVETTRLEEFRRELVARLPWKEQLKL